MITSAQDLSGPKPGTLPEGLLNLSGQMFAPTALVVDKSKKKIYLFKDEGGKVKMAAQYDADLGKKAGDKHSTGDSRTPEGIYFFDRSIDGALLDKEKYGVLAFVTNYPNFFDVRSGKSGYGIWLHAIADKTTLERGSQGCVVVRNDTIKLLQPEIKIKYTPLLIFDQVQWTPEEEIQKSHDKVMSFLKNWKAAWETKKMDEYIGSYDESFKFGHMNLKKFREYKTELASKYTSITVKLSDPQLFEHKGNVVVRFFQDYTSPDHADFGEKILYLKKIADQYKIVGEFWEPTTDSSKKSFASF